jgi:predicted outer membrane repeat protein
MRVASWPRGRREYARPASCARLRLVVLEDRSVPSTFNVTSASDDPILTSNKASGTLRYAVTNAAAGDKIVLKGAALGGITLTQGELLLKQMNLTIQTSSDKDQATISGGGAFRVFEVSTGADVTMKDLTITGGNAQTGNPNDPHENRGGGIVVDEGASLKMTGCTVTNNATPAIEIVGEGGLGGGIADYGTLTMTNCDVTDNQANGSYGGGIAVFSGAPFSAVLSATLTIKNSTVSGNSAVGNGGGICGVASTINVDNCDVSGNTVPYSGGGLNNHGGSMTISNSTVTGNTANYLGGGVSNYQSTDLVSSTLVITNTDFTGNKAPYGAAVDNSGTLTFKNSKVTGVTDPNSQFFFGAVFNESYGTAALKNVVLTGNSAVYGGGIDSEGTLSVVGCQLSMNNAYYSGGAIEAYGKTTIDHCTITDNFSMHDAGAVNVGGSTTISNSEISNNTAYGGDPDLPAGSGGAMIASGTTLIRNCQFCDNKAGYGGAIYFGYGTLTVARSTLSDNTALCGGALNISGGTAALISSKLCGNSANADSYYYPSGDGGAIYTSSGTLWISGSTKIMNNTAATAGGGIYVRGEYSTVTVALEDQTRIVNNTAPVGAGMDVFIGTKTYDWVPDVVFYLQGNSKLGDVSNGGVIYQDQDSTSTIENLYGNPVIPI